MINAVKDSGNPIIVGPSNKLADISIGFLNPWQKQQKFGKMSRYEIESEGISSYTARFIILQRDILLRDIPLPLSV